MVYVNISNILKDKVISVRWLSLKTGISYSNLSGLCKNRKQLVRLDYLERICDALDVGVNDIIKFQK